MNVDKICRGCELEILRILLTVDLRVMAMSEFDVILGMDWLMVYQVVIDRDRKRVTIYTPDGVCFMFKGISMMLYPNPCTNIDDTSS